MQLLQEEIDQQERLLDVSGIDYGDKITISPTDSTIPNGVSQLIKLREDYLDELERYADEKRIAHDCFSKLSTIPRVALTRYYIMCHTWEECWTTMGYSESHMMRIREQGLLELFYVMPGEWRTARLNYQLPYPCE